VVDPNLRPTLDQLKLENVFAVSPALKRLLTVCKNVDWVKAEARQLAPPIIPDESAVYHNCNTEFLKDKNRDGRKGEEAFVNP
jgi:hypothetical protein